MAEKATWYGKTGVGYTYNVYGLGSGWNDVPDNYLFAKTIEIRDGRKWSAIYIGETDSFKNRVGRHHERKLVNSSKQACRPLERQRLDRAYRRSAP